MTLMTMAYYNQHQQKASYYGCSYYWVVDGSSLYWVGSGSPNSTTSGDTNCAVCISSSGSSSGGSSGGGSSGGGSSAYITGLGTVTWSTSKMSYSAAQSWCASQGLSLVPPIETGGYDATDIQSAAGWGSDFYWSNTTDLCAAYLSDICIDGASRLTSSYYAVCY